MKDLALRTHIMVTTNLRALRDRALDEDGQTSVEYLGIIVVVVALIGAILAAIPGVGTAIVAKITGLVGGIGGAPAGPPTP